MTLSSHHIPAREIHDAKTPQDATGTPEAADKTAFVITDEMNRALQNAVITLEGGHAGDFSMDKDPASYTIHQLGWE